MATANRVFWETVTVIGLVLAIFAVWSGSRWMAGRKIRQAADEQQSMLDDRAHRQADEIIQIEKTAERWAERLAQSEAEAVFYSFSAGIHYASRERWGRVLGDAKDQFIRVPRVKFAHLITPGGRVIFTTRPEALQTGDDGEDPTTWAMASSDLRTRPGAEVGITELAGPVAGNLLWIGYDTAEAQRTGQPDEFGGDDATAASP